MQKPKKVPHAPPHFAAWQPRTFDLPQQQLGVFLLSSAGTFVCSSRAKKRWQPRALMVRVALALMGLLGRQ